MNPQPCNLELTLLGAEDVCPSCGHFADTHPKWAHGTIPNQYQTAEGVLGEMEAEPVVEDFEPTEDGGRTYIVEGASINFNGEAIPVGDLTFKFGPKVVEEKDPWQLDLPGMELDRGGEGKKFDGDKKRWDLLPWDSVEGLVDVITFGAAKYDANNWKKVRGWRWRYFGAAIRHLMAWWGGEKCDPETGLPHLHHALCNLAFLAHLDGRDQ